MEKGIGRSVSLGCKLIFVLPDNEQLEKVKELYKEKLEAIVL